MFTFPENIRHGAEYALASTSRFIAGKTKIMATFVSEVVQCMECSIQGTIVEISSQVMKQSFWGALIKCLTYSLSVKSIRKIDLP